MSASRHAEALGELLLSARRTLLLLPAAEAMVAALSEAKSDGLPSHLISRLRTLLPYRNAIEMQGWLVDAADGADGPRSAGQASWIRTERVAGDAQSAAYARGYMVIMVRPAYAHGHVADGAGLAPPDGKGCPATPEGRACHAATAAAAAGGLALPQALGLRLERSAACRLRSLLAHAPSCSTCSSSVDAGGSPPEHSSPAATAQRVVDTSNLSMSYCPARSTCCAP